MKFHMKWKMYALRWQIPAVANALVWLTGRNHLPGDVLHFFGQSALNFLLLGVIFASDRAFTVWEMGPVSLRERWFGIKTKEFAWEDIIRVGLANYERPDSCRIEIEYRPYGAARTCWRALKVNPIQREEFIATMKRFARAASFDLESKL